MDLLQSQSGAEDKVTVYAFRKDSASPLNLVLVNLITADGSTNVDLQLPAAFSGGTGKQYRISCSGPGCLYNHQGALLNGQAVNGWNTLSVLNNTAPTAVTYTNPAALTLPNHSVTFLELSQPSLPASQNIPQLSVANSMFLHSASDYDDVLHGAWKYISSTGTGSYDWQNTQGGGWHYVIKTGGSGENCVRQDSSANPVFVRPESFAGRTFKLSGFVRIDPNNAAQGYFRLNTKNASGWNYTNAATTTPALGVTSGWQPSEALITIPTDTTEVSNNTGGNNTLAKVFTSYTAGGQETIAGMPAMKVEATTRSTTTGTLDSPMTGTMEVEGTGAGTSTLFIGANGRLLGVNSSSTIDQTLKMSMVPTPVPVKTTQTVIITLLK